MGGFQGSVDFTGGFRYKVRALAFSLRNGVEN